MYTHYLEVTLAAAIVAKDDETAKEIISLIVINPDKTSASLTSVNDKNQTFLHLALEEGRITVVDALLVHLLQDDVIFKRDENNKSLILLATWHGYLDVLTQLIMQAEKKAEFKIWWQSDNHGQTPIHVAALAGREISLSLIISKLPNDEKIEVINAPDEDGNTALHFISQLTPFVVKKLIDAGADWSVHNNKNESPFMLIPLAIFRDLPDKSRSIVWKLYRQYRIDNPNSIDINKQFFKLSSSNGLNALAIAHHEFNHSLEIKNTYNISVREEPATIKVRNIQTGEEEIEAVEWQNARGIVTRSWELFVPDAILNQMPLYKKKVMAHEPSYVLDNLVSINTNKMISKMNYQVLDDDRLVINRLNQRLTSYIADLKKRPMRPKNTARVVQLGTAAIWLLYLAGIVILSTFQANAEDKLRAGNKSSVEGADQSTANLFLTLTLAFVVVGIAVVCLGTLGFVSCMEKRRTKVSPREYGELSAEIEKDIIEKLQQLEKFGVDNLTNTRLPV